jgi:predicted transposase YdaD
MEGKMEGKIEVAIALNKKGLSIHEISELTELPEDEIRKALR